MDPAAIEAQLDTLFIEEFEKTFVIDGTGAISCSNARIDTFNNFLQRWQHRLAREGFQLDVLQLERMGYQDVGTLNNNRKKLMGIYGCCFILYVKCCESVQQQGNRNYIAGIDIKIELD